MNRLEAERFDRELESVADSIGSAESIEMIEESFVKPFVFRLQSGLERSRLLR
jgi:hypothetical protein